MVLALDPGPDRTAYVLFDARDSHVCECGHVDNADILSMIFWGKSDVPVACETIQSYGMAVGESTFETAFWIGRYWQMAVSVERPFHRVKRSDVKLHLCHSSRAKDANVRQALLDMFSGPGGRPAVGTKKSPGPLYGVSGHAWSALAVAVAWSDGTGMAAESAVELPGESKV